MEIVSTDQLPVKLDQEYRVKLGKSFTFPRENAYHTIKYDFKPLSVDPTKAGKLRVVEDEVNVQLPVVQAESTDDVAQFRGPKKPATKECVLIIDTASGEAVLERISNTIQLKAIRDGRKSTNPRERSVSPCPPLATPSKATPTNKPTHPPTPSPGTTITKKRGPKSQKSSTKPENTTQNGSSNGKKKISKKSTKKSAIKTEPPPQMPTLAPPPSTVPSMPTPSVSGGSMDSGMSPAPSKKIKTVVASSSSGSSSDSSDSETPNVQIPSLVSNMPQLTGLGHMTQQSGHMTQQGSHMTPLSSHTTLQGNHMTQLGSHMTQPGQSIGHLPQQPQDTSSSSSSDSSDSSSGSSSSDSSSESSDQENDREVASVFTHTQQDKNIRPRTMSQLRTDLHLSDSGSDSDS